MDDERDLTVKGLWKIPGNRSELIVSPAAFKILLEVIGECPSNLNVNHGAFRVILTAERSWRSEDSTIETKDGERVRVSTRVGEDPADEAFSFVLKSRESLFFLNLPFFLKNSRFQNQNSEFFTGKEMFFTSSGSASATMMDLMERLPVEIPEGFDVKGFIAQEVSKALTAQDENSAEKHIIESEAITPKMGETDFDAMVWLGKLYRGLKDFNGEPAGLFKIKGAGEEELMGRLETLSLVWNDEAAWESLSMEAKVEISERLMKMPKEDWPMSGERVRVEWIERSLDKIDGLPNETRERMMNDVWERFLAEKLTRSETSFMSDSNIARLEGKWLAMSGSAGVAPKPKRKI